MSVCGFVGVAVCQHGNSLGYHREIFMGARYGQKLGQMAAFRCTAARGWRFNVSDVLVSSAVV